LLSRIAESLFWIGRYMERAEDTARILDVHIYHLLEAPLSSEDELCRSLLATMGTELPAPRTSGNSSQPAVLLTARQVTDWLAFDTANPGSIASSLVAARGNAREVSEAISSEMWEALNVTYNSLPAMVDTGRRAAPYSFFRFVRERAAIVAGLTESTMSRDDAYRFMVLGRSLERSDMLARLLHSALSSMVAETDWVVLLRSCSAHEAFLRTYRREPDPTTAAEFLLLDRLFPRSVFYCLSVAERCLAELGPSSGRTGTVDEARRVLGQMRTSLEFRRTEDLLEDLPGVLAEVQSGCAAASFAVAARYFCQTGLIAWTPEGAAVAGDVLDGANGPRVAAP
jgi:uncharacterized alpha-E superfamily protein